MDHILGLILLGLGIQSPFSPNVKGDSTVASASAISPSSGSSLYTTATSGKPPLGRPNIAAFETSIGKDRANFLEELAQRRQLGLTSYQASMSAFRANLAKIKDAKRQALLDKLNTQCQDINQKRTDKMSDMLTKLTDILTNITNRAQTAQANGKDITAVTTKITLAQQAIADAQAAVAAQAGTTCVLTFKSETSLKADVGKTISTLQGALKDVYNKVLAARMAVVDALKTLAQLTGEPLTGVGKTASGSAGTHD